MHPRGDGLTAASFYLNGVFAFAISVPGRPKIRPAFSRANGHLRVILAWGCSIGLALSFSALIATRWGHWPFVISQSIVVGMMMLCYIAVPARIVGVEKKAQSRRDTLAASAVGGAVGAVVCSPPYMLGRFGILMLGWPYVFWLGVMLIVMGATLQTGATSAVKAVKFSAKLVGHPVRGRRAARRLRHAPPQSATSASVSPLTASRAAVGLGAEAVAGGQGGRRGVADGGAPAGLGPDEDLQREVEGGQRRGHHDARAGGGVPEDHQGRLPQLEPERRGPRPAGRSRRRP